MFALGAYGGGSTQSLTSFNSITLEVSGLLDGW